jgi:shikimate kinase
MERRRNIVLTGFMATGKSTIGRVLAERLGYVLVDTDTLIETRHGSIASIFADRGEPAFRDIEREVAAELGGGEGMVVSTGGRMMLDPANAASLGADGLVICLTASVDTIVDRLSVSGTADRPLLAGPDLRERVTHLLEERGPSYAAFTQVVTDGKSPEEIVDEIVTLVA